ncbi:AAA family ATPase [Acinetobacter baumannii]|uniref:AAA family ATPase n=1 Tax=Acinetobacter baumannii TaxID=470 RepID=UPI0020A092CD|nr:AAA family ATPase [Acinetobacter baumannii]MCO9053112.1 ATP-binding protein [Acinetobacter baumannii]MCO9057327.1 ATP-binding protein [Acinetobacter baumannii]MCO9060479.1 ATP-binding protein [Acinetobacter baumannii]MCO9064701.1 ATP-binding protein [Acinetobacter baumannii]MCO9068006.1 ATP-binding protein [Acinetobacter baumannii]
MNMQSKEQFSFTKAERKKAKLKLNLNGASGSGKTYSALVLASSLGKKIAVIDTENESASFYANEFNFDTLPLKPPYSPERFAGAIHAAHNMGYEVLIIDSASHEWIGTGGCLEINDEAAKRFKGNTWSAWSETTPRHRKFIDAILQTDMHIITTTRAKTETVQGEKGKVIKLGMKAEQREGYEYELTVSLDMLHENKFAIPTKDRTKLFNPAGEVITKETGEKLIAWLNDGRSQEEALQAAFDEAIKRINATTDVAELGIIYSQFKGTDCEAEIVSACSSRKHSLIGTQGNA